MFRVSNPNLPKREKTTTFRTQPFNGAILAKKAPEIPKGKTTATTESGKLIINNSHSLTITDKPKIVISITTNDKKYSIYNGDFCYNPSTGVGVFNVNVNLSEVSAIAYEFPVYSSEQNKFKSNEIPLNKTPEIFKKYVITECNFSRPWRGHPSGSFAIEANLEKKETILQEIAIDKILNLYGVTYRISSFNIEEFPLNNKLTVTVELQGCWQSRGNTIRSPLDKPIRLLDLAKPGKSYYLSQLAAKAGARLTGASNIKIKVPKGTGERESTTLGSEIERVIVEGKFLDYESSKAIAAKYYSNQKVHIIDDSKVRSESVNYSYNGQGALFNGINLAHEYSHVKVDIQSDKDDSNKTGVRTVLKSGDLNPETLPTINRGSYQEGYSLDYLRSPSNSFDNGGITKTLKTSYLIDGTTVKETEETYGFLFNSLDVYTIAGGGNSVKIIYGKPDFFGLSQFWLPVKSTTTIYNYRKDGYLESAITTGWEYYREKKESGENPKDFELIQLQEELNDIEEERDENGNLLIDSARMKERLRILAKMSFYEFKKRPLNIPTTYELESKKKYYKDLQSADPEPLFVKKQVAEENTLVVRPDPDSTIDQPLPAIVSGIHRIDKIENAIASPMGINAAQSPEMFKTTQLTQTKEGTNFQNFASQSNYQESLGRPNDQQYFKLVEPSNDVKEEPDEQEEEKSYYISTPGAVSLDKRVYSQSVGFTGADSLEKALLAARADLCMKNTESISFSLEVDWDDSYKPGDRALWEGRLWIIKNISDSQQARGGKLISENFKIDLGSFLDVPLILSSTI